MVKKQIFIKSYTSAGVLKGVIQDASFSGFTKNINGGLGNLILKLARKIDNFNAGDDVSIGNIIKIYVSDEDAVNVLIYQGIIEEQIFNVNNNQNIDIICYGYINRLKNDILKDGVHTTFGTHATLYLDDGTTTASVAELANVIRKIIDFWNAINTDAPILYNVSGVDTIVNCSAAIRYLFKAVSYFDAIEICRKVAPQNSFWFLDENNVMNFNVSSDTVPTHTFTIGKNIKSIRIEKTLQETSNVLHLVDSGAGLNYRKYSDAASIGSYGRRATVITDNGWGDTATMDKFGAAFINEKKNPFIKIELEIYDNNDNSDGYNIESIKPGDTCAIKNLDNSEDIVGASMIITQVDWTPDLVRLTISFNKFDLNKYLVDIRADLDKESLPAAASLPVDYTEVS